MAPSRRPARWRGVALQQPRALCFPARVSGEIEGREELRREASVFARYLMGRVPPPEVIERYERAGRRLFTSQLDESEAAVLAFVRRRPWSAPLLDAAAGILRPGGALRNRLLVMAAILETSPAHADDFLPRSASLGSLVAQLAVHGARAITALVVGLPVYWVATRSRR